MGLRGFEPRTSRLSGGRSNQLSYKPTVGNRFASRSCLERQRDGSPRIERGARSGFSELVKDRVTQRLVFTLPCSPIGRSPRALRLGRNTPKRLT